MQDKDERPTADLGEYYDELVVFLRAVMNRTCTYGALQLASL